MFFVALKIFFFPPTESLVSGLRSFCDFDWNDLPFVQHDSNLPNMEIRGMPSNF